MFKTDSYTNQRGLRVVFSANDNASHSKIHKRHVTATSTAPCATSGKTAACQPSPSNLLLTRGIYHAGTWGQVNEKTCHICCRFKFLQSTKVRAGRSDRHQRWVHRLPWLPIPISTRSRRQAWYHDINYEGQFTLSISLPHNLKYSCLLHVVGEDLVHIHCGVPECRGG